MDNQQLLTVWVFALGLLVLLGSLFAWYQYVHRSTYGVFWDTIDNNLNINGVTRTIEQQNNGADFNQKLQISLGAENVARGITTVTQPSAEGNTVVVSETVGTPTENFVRYVDVNVAGSGTAPADVASIKNVWSREPLTQGGQLNQSILAEGLFSSFPLARLNQPQRQEVVQFMKDNKVYSVDYKNAKEVSRGGKQGFEYVVVVDLPGYIATLKMIDTMMGLKQLESVDPSAYEGAEPAELTVVNSINGRQLLEVTYNGSSRKEKYSAYGARINVAIPEAYLLRSELEQKVQTIFAPAGGA